MSCSAIRKLECFHNSEQLLVSRVRFLCFEMYAVEQLIIKNNNKYIRAKTLIAIGRFVSSRLIVIIPGKCDS